MGQGNRHQFQWVGQENAVNRNGWAKGIHTNTNVSAKRTLSEMNGWADKRCINVHGGPKYNAVNRNGWAKGIHTNTNVSARRMLSEMNRWADKGCINVQSWAYTMAT